MQDRLEIRTEENPVDHYVEITKLIGPRKLDLPPEGGFYVCPLSGRLLFVCPGQKPLLVLKEGMCLSSSKYRERHEFIVETRAELHSQKRKTVEIEINKPVEQDAPGSEVKIKTPYERKNTGIIVTTFNSRYPTVTHIQALSYNELPHKYRIGVLPKIWQDEDKLLTGHDCILLEIGRTYPLQVFRRKLQHIQLAGEHLAMVNRKANFEWLNCTTATFKDGKLKSTTTTV